MAIEPQISDHLVPPGFYVKEALEAIGMTQSELADRMGRPSQAISEIINAKKEITEETACDLETVLGAPAHIWLNLEAIYRLGLQAKKREEQLAAQYETAVQFPYNELVKLGAVQKTKDWSVKVRELQTFFRVARLDLVASSYSAAFRTAKTKSPCPYALASWLRLGELSAEQADLPDFDRVKARASLSDLRRATRTEGDLGTEVRDILGACGIAFAVVPHLPKTYANGAAFWHRSRPVVMVSLRGVYEDIFWFTLFHEIGHILLHSRSSMFIEGLDAESRQEDEADEFARDTLIPGNAWSGFVDREDWSREAVLAFAESLEIAPAIVVGRLCHELKAFHLLHDLRTLRRKLELVDGSA